MIDLVISGGQTGADQAGWRAAKAAGIPTGGWMPKGYRTEDGFHPEFAEIYGARAFHLDGYPARTKANVRWADVTIVFDTSPGKTLEELSRGSQLAFNEAMRQGKPSILVRARLGEPIPPERPEGMARGIEGRYGVLNVAGNRESSAPGIGEWVEAYLAEVFRLVKGS